MRVIAAAAVLVGVWLVLAGTIGPAEWAAGGFAAACGCASVAAAVTRSRLAELYTLRPLPCAATMAAALGRAAGDSIPVSKAIARAVVGGRRAAGSRSAQPIGSHGLARSHLSRRAVATTLASYAPNSAVVEVDPAHDRLVVHTLVRRGA